MKMCDFHNPLQEPRARALLSLIHSEFAVKPQVSLIESEKFALACVHLHGLCREYKENRPENEMDQWRKAERANGPLSLTLSLLKREREKFTVVGVGR